MRGDRECRAIDRYSNAEKALHYEIGEGIKDVMVYVSNDEIKRAKELIIRAMQEE